MEQPIIQKLIKTKIKKPDLNTKAGKYLVAKMQGKNKTEAALTAGYPDGNHTTRIEATKTYQAIAQTYYKDELLKRISLGQIADEQIKNIIQDNDRGAKNKAIEMAINRIEPQDMPTDDTDSIYHPEVELKG